MSTWIKKKQQGLSLWFVFSCSSKNGQIVWENHGTSSPEKNLGVMLNLTFVNPWKIQETWHQVTIFTQIIVTSEACSMLLNQCVFHANRPYNRRFSLILEVCHGQRFVFFGPLALAIQPPTGRVRNVQAFHVVNRQLANGHWITFPIHDSSAHRRVAAPMFQITFLEPAVGYPAW